MSWSMNSASRDSLKRLALLPGTGHEMQPQSHLPYVFYYYSETFELLTKNAFVCLFVYIWINDPFCSCSDHHLMLQSDGYNWMEEQNKKVQKYKTTVASRRCGSADSTESFPDSSVHSGQSCSSNVQSGSLGTGIPGGSQSPWALSCNSCHFIFIILLGQIQS